VLFPIFGNVYTNGTFGTTLSTEQKRLVDYTVARWGATVDLWQLCNEKTPPSAWTYAAAAYVRQVDPYKHPVSVTGPQQTNIPKRMSCHAWTTSGFAVSMSQGVSSAALRSCVRARVTKRAEATVLIDLADLIMWLCPFLSLTGMVAMPT
jgi:hypothetical protein